MNFRVFAAGIVFMTAFQVLVAAAVVLFIVHRDAPGGATDLEDRAVVPCCAPQVFLCCAPQVFLCCTPQVFLCCTPQVFP